MITAKPGESVRDATLLVVDDEEQNVRTLHRILDVAGYERVRSTTDPRRVLSMVEEAPPDLVLLDLHMPGMSGFEVLDRLAELDLEGGPPPVLVLTADHDPGARERALSAGARDFVTKPFEISEVLLRIRNLLEMRRLHLEAREHARTLEVTVRDRTLELAEAQVEILHRLALAAEFRDDVTGQHAERVGVVSAYLARELGLGADRVELLRRAAPLHDVGKIGIPDAILRKEGPLTTAEFEVMKSHTTIGARILSGGRFPLLRMARDVARYHHERWDGGGYHGLSGDDIPLVGRIVAVADAFDSLTHERPYKHAVPVADAVDVVTSDAGRHFDPDVAEAFRRLTETGLIETVEARAARREPVGSAGGGTRRRIDRRGAAGGNGRFAGVASRH